MSLGTGSFADDLRLSGLGPAGAAPGEHDARVDMTAMIDLVFMLNIFFLVTSLVTAMAEIDLPAAKHVVAADLEQSVVMTITSAGGNRTAVFIGDGDKGEAIPRAQQEDRIAAAVAEGRRNGKRAVIIKAERKVPLGEVVRVAAAATTLAEDVALNLAVMEKD